MKKILYNQHTHLLEENQYVYGLQDVPTPELFRQVFPYDMVPKVTYNHRHVPINMPEEIYISDTSFRDGQQSRTPYTVEQVVNIYKMQLEQNFVYHAMQFLRIVCIIRI